LSQTPIKIESTQEDLTVVKTTREHQMKKVISMKSMAVKSKTIRTLNYKSSNSGEKTQLAVRGDMVKG
jgi:hypothetical protein